MREWLIEIATTFGITLDELTGDSRRRHIVEARQTAAWLLRHAFKRMTLSEIGDLLGREYTTIIYAIESVEMRMLNDPDYTHMVHSLLAMAPIRTRPTRRPGRRPDDPVFWGVRIARCA